MTTTNYQEFDDKLMLMYTQTRFYDEDDSSVEGELIQVTQHLAPEQYQYEFPTKTCLKALAYLDSESDEYSFFDESSFTTTTTALSSVIQQQTSDYFSDQDTTTMISHMNQSSWHETIVEEEEEDEDELVDDGRLSPLQLPAQVNTNKLDRRPRESSSCETITQSDRPVGPSSFLSDIHRDHMYKHVTQSRANTTYIPKDYSSLSLEDDEEDNLRVFCNESDPIMDTDFDSSTDSSVRTTESRIVLIKLNKFKQSPMSIVQRCPTSLTYLASDEGYDDSEQDEGEELESHCVFYPLSENDDDEDNTEYLDSKRDQAAIKIQSLWRGYRSRRENKQQFSNLRADQRVLVNLAQLCGRLHRRQMNCVDDRLHQLEQRVREETAMRMAFEKAMEDMTVLIDQQQKILYDRLEQEVHMRQVYESKMNSALTQLQPLEARLRKEVAARNKMEEMMTRVLDQMHETETSRQQQVKEDAEDKKIMQHKLEQAMEEIAIIKKQQAVSSSSRPRINSSKNSSTKTVTHSSTSTTTTTASIKKESVSINNSTSRAPIVRRSIVPAAASIKNDTTSTIRRQQQSRFTTNSIITNNNNNSKKHVLLERPSVIPSNRRPVLGTTAASTTTKQRTISITTTTTTPPTSRRPLLTRK